MKREQLKKLMKPLIKECIHEVIIESGVLATIITEVTKGYKDTSDNPQLVSEQQIPQAAHAQPANKQKELLDLRRKQLTSAIGNKAYSNIFEGVEPMRSQTAPSTDAAALAGVAPHDPGVDISGIVATAGKSWKTLAKGKKR